MATLIIGAHPDDEVLGVGGTIAKLAAEHNESVFVLIVTDGSSSQYPDDLAKHNTKVEELKRCCACLGVTELVHGDLPDMQLDQVPHTKINALIEQHIAKWQPRTIYTHFPDVNRDHVRIFDSTLVAARPTPNAVVRQVIAFPTPSATEWGSTLHSAPFHANYFVDIERHIDTKIAALECYATELRDFPHPRSPQAVRALAAATGIKVGRRYAEEFAVIREIV